MASASAVSGDDPFAAALAAAAELAKNGGAFLLNPVAVQELVLTQKANTSATAAAAAVLVPPPAAVLPPSIDFMISAAAASDHSPSSLASLQHKYSSDDDEDYDEDIMGEDSNEEDAERRIARSRERNREHARRTRLRKKAQLEALQCKVKGLQAESKVLKQSLEECSIASILVGLSSGERDATIQSLVKEATEIEEKEILKVVTGGKRKRFLSDVSTSSEQRPSSSQPLTIKIDGKLTLIGGGQTHINWKSGMYCDEDGLQRQLTHEQLESLRRERNRMHAKMTRDRKKNFIATIQKTVEELESSNRRMKAVLADVIQTHFKINPPVVPAGVTPTSSPSITPNASFGIHVPPLAAQPLPVDSRATAPAASSNWEEIASITPIPKRVCHGFTLAL